MSNLGNSPRGLREPVTPCAYDRSMKRIVLEIDMEEGSNVVTWRLDDWRGSVSSGVSVDATSNLVHLWAGDIEHVMDEVRGEVEVSGLVEQ
jgi:hypothetical protein